MIEQIEAEIFHDFQMNGYSRPARLTCRRANGQQIEVFIKFAAGVRDHYFGLCAELLCSIIARKIGLFTPEPFIVNLSPEFLSGAPNDAKDMISRSIGLNFGTVTVGPGFAVMPTEPRPPDLRMIAAEIFAFDVMMQNFDRKRDNPNLLWDGKRIALIDHERALYSVLQWSEFTYSNLDLDKFYDHVLYSAISPADANFQRLVIVLQTLTPTVVDEIFDELPRVWRNEVGLTTMKNYINFLVDKRQAVCNLIQQMIVE